MDVYSVAGRPTGRPALRSYGLASLHRDVDTYVIHCELNARVLLCNFVGRAVGPRPLVKATRTIISSRGQLVG